jgi:small subunit ribosomal protein S2
MAPYIFGSKDNIHIINLDRTSRLLQAALKVASDIASDGGRILFVGTKRQSSERVAEAAKKCGQYYVNHRWLGGMLTNWKTVSQSIKKLDSLERRLEDVNIVLKKKEILTLRRKADNLNKVLGGVRSMGGVPSMLFVLDILVDKTAVEEARALGIPVIGVCDTNADPTLVDYPIPGNDDSVRAIDLYCSLMESAIISGILHGLASAGVDVGALENPVEDLKSSDEIVSAESADESSADGTDGALDQ